MTTTAPAITRTDHTVTVYLADESYPYTAADGGRYSVARVTRRNAEDAVLHCHKYDRHGDLTVRSTFTHRVALGDLPNAVRLALVRT